MKCRNGFSITNLAVENKNGGRIHRLYISEKKINKMINEVFV